MDFKGNYRIEAVYFEKLKRNINEAKRLLESGATEEARFLLEDSVDVDGSVLLLYRNLGELWADLANKLEETKKALQDLDEKNEKYHDELNEKIDEVNNYIMSLIRHLEETKQDKLTPGNGIDITGNEIKSTLLELKNYGAVTGLKNYTIQTLEQEVDVQHVFYKLKMTCGIKATGALLKEYLGDANSFRMNLTLRTKAISTWNDSFQQGDSVLYNLTSMEANQGIIPYLVGGQCFDLVNYGPSTVLTINKMAIHMLGIGTYLHDLNDDEEYTISCVLIFAPMVNGKYITNGSEYIWLTDPANYIFSGFTLRKYY